HHPLAVALARGGAEVPAPGHGLLAAHHQGLGSDRGVDSVAPSVAEGPSLHDTRFFVETRSLGYARDDGGAVAKAPRDAYLPPPWDTESPWLARPAMSGAKCCKSFPNGTFRSMTSWRWPRRARPAARCRSGWTRS